MQKTRIILGTYNHLPEGTGESEFESAYQICWRPFLSVLYRFPDISAAIHFSGTVLRWLEIRHPEFLMLLDEMLLRKQIELLGGAFFAPLLPIIPAADRLGQIEMLTTFLRKNFNKKPHGFWLQDYAWEPSVASALRACGFDYTFMTEEHFRQAGISTERLTGPCLTEDQGRSVAVFPVFDASESLPSLMPAEAAIDWILSSTGGLPLATLMYDGILTQELWLQSGLESPDVFFEKSFAAIQKNVLVYETTTPSRYFKTVRHFEKAYFPGCSSNSLRLASSVRQSDGAAEVCPDSICHGNTRRILTASSQGANLYAKMQYVRILVGQLRGDKSRKKTAQEELWRGQCGGAYWSGSQGCIKSLPVRARAFAALLDAEKMTHHHGGSVSGIIRTDIDFDGEKEIVFQGGETNAYIHLRGGAVFELDSLGSRTNYVNVMSPDSELAKRMNCCLDRIYADAENLTDCGSFADSYYSLQDSAKPVHTAVLTREGWWVSGSRHHALSIQKTYVFAKTGFSLNYEITNKAAQAVSFFFSSEFNLAAALSPDDLEIHALKGRKTERLAPAEKFRVDSCSGIRIENTEAGEVLEMRSDLPFGCVHMPVYMNFPHPIQTDKVSAYQGCTLLPLWEMNIPADSARRFSLTVEIQSS